MSNLRLVTLSDGSGMGDCRYVFNTDAPSKVLKELERESCAVYRNGGNDEDVPIWADVLNAKGYTFDYVDECEHVTAFGTSSDWVNEVYPQITEHYYIENQYDDSEREYE